MESFFDNDYYKFTAGQVVFNQFSHVDASYELFNRDNRPFPEGFADRLNEKILTFPSPKAEEMKWLKGFDQKYLNWLESYKFNPDEVMILQTGSKLKVKVGGPWHRIIYWEVPLMATISQLYFIQQHHDEYWMDRISQKTKHIEFLYKNYGVQIGDFGTRRRFSSGVHNAVVSRMADKPGFMGTSNVYFANLYGVPALGTYGHECPMAMQAEYGFRQADRVWMDAWIKEWRGKNGIAVPDTLTTDHFLKCFDGVYARVFDGIKQDSGNSEEFTIKIIEHYEKLGIDPKFKKIVYTDSLNLNKVEMLAKKFHNKIQIVAGIGTNFTNDVGHKPLNIVIKMTGSDFGNGMKPVIKLSDEPGKYTGDSQAIARAKEELA